MINRLRAVFLWMYEMAFVSLLFGLAGNQTMVGSVPLDALLTEDTELSANASQYAVEDGTVVSDHITREPERLSMSGIISAASIYTFGAGGRSKLIAAKDALRQIHDRRVPITIITGADVYVNFAMVNARISRTNEGEQLSLICGFQKIDVTQLREADIPPAKVAASTKGKAGKTGAKGGKISDQTAPKRPTTELKEEVGGLYS